LESILPKIPSTNTLLITNTHKPDARNKSVKLLLEYAQVNKSWKSSNPGHPDSDKKGLKDKQDKVFN
jgi:hypothetical protein